jgi:hypothetical protein
MYGAETLILVTQTGDFPKDSADGERFRPCLISTQVFARLMGKFVSPRAAARPWIAT